LALRAPLCHRDPGNIATFALSLMNLHGLLIMFNKTSGQAKTSGAIPAGP